MNKSDELEKWADEVDVSQFPSKWGHIEKAVIRLRERTRVEVGGGKVRAWGYIRIARFLLDKGIKDPEGNKPDLRRLENAVRNIIKRHEKQRG